MNHYQVLFEMPVSDIDIPTLTTNATRIADVTTDSVKDDSYVNEEISDMKQNCEMVLSYPDRRKKNPLIEDMYTYHSKRKINSSSLIEILRAYAKTTVKDKPEAAKYLLEIIGDYSALKKTPSSKAASEYKKFFDKLSGPKALEAMELLNVKDIFTETVSSNDNFESLYKTKISTATPIPELSIDELKDKIIEHLTSILKYIDSKAARKTEGFVEAAEKINIIIADYLKIYKAEKTRNENSATDPKEKSETPELVAGNS